VAGKVRFRETSAFLPFESACCEALFDTTCSIAAAGLPGAVSAASDRSRSSAAGSFEKIRPESSTASCHSGSVAAERIRSTPAPALRSPRCVSARFRDPRYAADP